MMPRPLARLGLALLCLCSIPAARADDSPSGMPAFGDPATAVDLSGEVTLENCVAQALARNFNVKIQWFGIEQSSDSVVIQQAAFEPTLGFNSNRAVVQDATDQALPYTSGYTSTTTSTVSFSDTVITGGTVSANYSLERGYFLPAYTEPDPAFGSAVSLTVTQPILNGAGTDYNRAAIESAKLGVTISKLNFKSAILTMVLNVETTYYNLLFQREQYKVQLEQLKQAQQLLDENTIRRETGVQTDLDVVNAQAGVAAAKNLLIVDEQAVHNSEDALLQLLGDRQFSTVVGATNFPFVGEPEVSFDRSYKLARDNGPNLAVAQATIEQFKLAALKAKRAMLPTLNLNGGLGYNSYASTAGQSFTGSWSGYNWTAGVTLSVPWGLSAGRAAYRQAEAGVRSEQVAYDEADQTLVVGVRAAVRAVQTSIASVRSSAENTKFAQKAYELTKAQFDAGLATSYLVLQSQNTLETARVSELQAKVNLLSAIANLRFLEGSSLQLYRINLPE
jgi:outer membrane protein